MKQQLSFRLCLLHPKHNLTIFCSLVLVESDEPTHAVCCSVAFRVSRDTALRRGTNDVLFAGNAANQQMQLYDIVLYGGCKVSTTSKEELLPTASHRFPERHHRLVQSELNQHPFLVGMSDLVPLRCEVNARPVDIDTTLMQISITGSADLQRSIRLVCNEYIDIFCPKVR
jgi:hypothetical protein